MSRLLTVLAAVGASLAWACGGRGAEDQCAEGDRECLNNQYYDNCEEIQARIAGSYRPNGYDIGPPPAWDDQWIEDPPMDLARLKQMTDAGQCTRTVFWRSPIDKDQKCFSTVTYQLNDDNPQGFDILDFERTEAEACSFIPSR
ncbi:MAG: hypothetical protein HYT76_10330 [Deltaproteobacteria bacterium]|nr:hypothetical protein [Deltaproteobacteria bacterium]